MVRIKKPKRKELTKYPNSSLAKARGVCSKPENQKMYFNDFVSL